MSSRFFLLSTKNANFLSGLWCRRVSHQKLKFFFSHISVWECDKTLNLSFAKRGRSHSRSHLMFAVLLFGRFLFSIHHSERYNFLVFFFCS